MNPITSLQNATGLITLTIRQFKTVFNYDGDDFQSFGTLNDRLKQNDPFYTYQDSLALNLSLLRLERSTLKAHYFQAIKPKSINSLICELSDLGVETTRLQIPCINSDCDEVAIEEVDAPARLDEVQSEAESACEFVDGLCPACKRQDDMEAAEEDIARARQEDREGCA
jgi:hypothetical protein